MNELKHLCASLWQHNGSVHALRDSVNSSSRSRPEDFLLRPFTQMTGGHLGSSDGIWAHFKTFRICDPIVALRVIAEITVLLKRQQMYFSSNFLHFFFSRSHLLSLKHKKSDKTLFSTVISWSSCLHRRPINMCFLLWEIQHCALFKGIWLIAQSRIVLKCSSHIGTKKSEAWHVAAH